MNTPESNASAPVYYGYPFPERLDDDEVRALLTQWATRPGAPQFYADALAVLVKEKPRYFNEPLVWVYRTNGVFSVVEDPVGPGAMKLCERELLDILAHWYDSDDILSAREARALVLAHHATDLENLWPAIEVREYTPAGSLPRLKVVVLDRWQAGSAWWGFEIEDCTSTGVTGAFEDYGSDLGKWHEDCLFEEEEDQRARWERTRHGSAAMAMARLPRESYLGEWVVVDARLPDGSKVFGLIQGDDPMCALRGVTADRTGRAIQAEIERIEWAATDDPPQRIRGVTVVSPAARVSTPFESTSVDASRRSRP